jgi:formylglycine-generating enzyme required for sulfatase activity
MQTELGLVSAGRLHDGHQPGRSGRGGFGLLNDYKGSCDISYAQDSFPPHRVVLDSFQMELNEVTAAQYVAFLNALGPNSHLTGCQGNPCAATSSEAENSNIAFDGTTYSVANLFANLPMTNVTWYGAAAYCNALGRRLPTEAEWERAARGTDQRIYPYGNEWSPTAANTTAMTCPARARPTGRCRSAAIPMGAARTGCMTWPATWPSGFRTGIRPTTTARRLPPGRIRRGR